MTTNDTTAEALGEQLAAAILERVRREVEAAVAPLRAELVALRATLATRSVR